MTPRASRWDDARETPVLIRLYNAGLEYDEIASLMNRSVGHLTNRVHILHKEGVLAYRHVPGGCVDMTPAARERATAVQPRYESDTIVSLFVCPANVSVSDFVKKRLMAGR